MDKSKIGAALSALRGTHWHYCAWPECGKRFSGIKKARFCSNACRQKNKYAKVRAAREHGPEEH
jgi:hypothetical protein